MGSCKGVCDRFKVPGEGRRSEYLEGKRFCKACHCYFVTDRRFCQCCGTQLRVKPHDTRLKEKVRELERKTWRPRRSKRNYFLRNKDNPEFRLRHRIRNRLYEMRNKEKRREIHNNYNRTHRDRIAGHQRRYYEKNMERLRAKQRQRYVEKKALKQQMNCLPIPVIVTNQTK